MPLSMPRQLSWPAPPIHPCHPTHPQISVFEMARILANMLDGGSEESLFFGGAGQFVVSASCTHRALYGAADV